jgi:hypothetical protein
MTVKELRDKLSGFQDGTSVYVYWEEGSEHQFFGIEDVSMQKGEPKRFSDGKVGFKFDSNGPVSWLFLSVGPE